MYNRREVKVALQCWYEINEVTSSVRTSSVVR